jgi:phage shock protein A
MSTLRHLVIDLRAGLRKISEDLENHEAVAESAIAKLAGLRAKTALEVSRLQRQSRNLDEQIEFLQQEVITWRERARKSATADEAKALECVQRMSNAQRQANSLARELEHNQALEGDVRNDLEAMDAKLRELRRRRTSFTCREARAQAQFGEPSTFQVNDPTEAAFERWEQRILLQESRCTGDSSRLTDRLEDGFRREEEAEQLRSLLKDIVDTGEKPQ